jgi:predicted metal-binding protein
MSRPTLTICTRCHGGEALYEAVRERRRELCLKEVFKLEEERCLKCCSEPIALELSGKKRSTYTRLDVRKKDADVVIAAAVAYAALEPGEELPERLLPGDEG